MDNKIIPSFRDSVFTNALGDPSLDILEIGIDSIFENEIFIWKNFLESRFLRL